jgi:hypothetical protein
MLRIRLSISNTLELIPTVYTLTDDKFHGFAENIKSKNIITMPTILKEVLQEVGNYVRSIIGEN